jgi:hypothetical protein
MTTTQPQSRPVVRPVNPLPTDIDWRRVGDILGVTIIPASPETGRSRSPAREAAAALGALLTVDGILTGVVERHPPGSLSWDEVFEARAGVRGAIRRLRDAGVVA